MKVDFSVARGEIEDFVEGLQVHKYVRHGTFFAGKRKGEPWQRKVTVKWLDLSESEILNFIKNQKHRCILNFDRDDQAFPGEDLLNIDIYNGDIE